MPANAPLRPLGLTLRLHAARRVTLIRFVEPLRDSPTYVKDEASRRCFVLISGCHAPKRSVGSLGNALVYTQ